MQNANSEDRHRRGSDGAGGGARRSLSAGSSAPSGRPRAKRVLCPRPCSLAKPPPSPQPRSSAGARGERVRVGRGARARPCKEKRSLGVLPSALFNLDCLGTIENKPESTCDFGNKYSRQAASSAGSLQAGGGRRRGGTDGRRQRGTGGAVQEEMAVDFYYYYYYPNF